MEPVKLQNQQQQEELIKDNDFAVIYQSEENTKLVQLRAGDKYQAINGAFRHINMINIPWGSSVQSFNKPGQKIYVLKPKPTLITETLARKTQILFTMDNSVIIFKLNLRIGSVVVEAGTGSGSLSCALSESIGSTGRLYTFQFNKERAEITKEFFQKMGKNNITSNWRDVVNDGFGVQGHNIRADALFLDIPNPWAALQNAKKVLKQNGRICCFSPCIEQVQRTCEQMRVMKMKNIETHQSLIREFQWKKNQVDLQGIQQNKRLRCYTRAQHTNRGHTGYLTFAIV